MPLCLLVLQTGNLGPLFRSNMFNQIGSWLWPAVCAYPLLRAILATSVSFLIPLSIALVTSVLIIGLARYLFYCWNYGIFRKSTAAGDQIPCQVSDHVKINHIFTGKNYATLSIRKQCSGVLWLITLPCGVIRTASPYKLLYYSWIYPAPSLLRGGGGPMAAAVLFGSTLLVHLPYCQFAIILLSLLHLQ
jgi:hypothetical protein